MESALAPLHASEITNQTHQWISGAKSTAFDGSKDTKPWLRLVFTHNTDKKNLTWVVFPREDIDRVL